MLALRMPYQQEELPDGRVQPNDDRLVLPPSPPMVDCIIAEVKEPATFGTSGASSCLMSRAG